MAVSTDEQEVLDKLREVLEHGYGRVEVVIQDQRILNVIWQKSKLLNQKNKAA